MEELKNHGKKWMYWFILGAALIIIYKILDKFPNVLETIGGFFAIISPFFIGLFIAYLLYLPCAKIENIFMKSKNKFVKKKARTFSIFSVLVIVVVLLILVVNFIFPVIAESTIELVSNLQGYYETAINNYQNLPNDSFIKNDIIGNGIDMIKHIDWKQYVSLQNIEQITSGAMGIVTNVVNTFVAIIVSIYVLAERDRIKAFVKKSAKAILKTKKYNVLEKYFNDANRIFLGFISGQLIDAVVVGVISTIALSIMGIKYAPLLGFMIGLFNIIPYVGAIIGVGISALITLITGGLTQAIWMLIVVIVLQQIDANVINPKIIGNTLKVSPLLVIFAVTIGGAYWGMLGIFLAVPASALIKIIVEDYIELKTIANREKEEKDNAEKSVMEDIIEK